MTIFPNVSVEDACFVNVSFDGKCIIYGFPEGIVLFGELVTGHRYWPEKEFDTDYCNYCGEHKSRHAHY